MEHSHTNLDSMVVPGVVMLGRRVKTVKEDLLVRNQSLHLLIKEKGKFCFWILTDGELKERLQVFVSLKNIFARVCLRILTPNIFLKYLSFTKTVEIYKCHFYFKLVFLIHPRAGFHAQPKESV